MCLSKNFFVKHLHRIRTKVLMFKDLLDLITGYLWDNKAASKVCQANKDDSDERQLSHVDLSATPAFLDEFQWH